MARILVVDDASFIARLIASTFEQKGHEAEIACDGEQAVEMARRLVPDLIILDIMMPRVDGIEVARTLRSDPGTGDIPILIVSSAADMRTVASAYAADVDEYVVKPFDTEELLEKARLLLEGSHGNSGGGGRRAPLTNVLHDEVALGSLAATPRDAAQAADTGPAGTASGPAGSPAVTEGYVSFEEHDRMVIARVAGPELRAGVLDRVKDRALDSPLVTLLDLEEVTSVSPAEARSLASLGETMSLSGRELKIVNPNARVADSLRRAGLGGALFWMREQRRQALHRSTDVSPAENGPT